MLNIVQLHWERANLHLTVDCEINGDVFLVKEDQKLLLQTAGKEIVLPVYNLPQGESLPAGKWRFVCNDTIITVSKELISDFENLSRNFFYRNEKYALLINFDVDGELGLCLYSRYMMINHSPKKFFRPAEGKGLKDKLKVIFAVLGMKAAALYYKILRLFRRPKNVLFLTENNNELTGNLKMLYGHMDFKKYKVRVFAENTCGSKKKSYGKTLKELTYLGLSSVIFVDNYCSLLTGIKPGKNVKLIQLWHAGLGFKALGYARFGIAGSPHPFYSCHREYTHVFLDDERFTDIYEEMFACNRNAFRAVGIPRLDEYLDRAKYLATADSLYAENRLLKTKKTILFAPTFRGQSHKEAHYDFSALNFDVIYDFLKRNGFVMLLKMHPFINNKPDISEKYRDRIFDYSDHEINDLIYISDILITDYSSCAYEFSLFNRPLIFFRYDKTVFEYEHHVFTLDVFSKKQREVQTFDELMKVLNEIKDDLPADRFSEISKADRKDVCKAILADVFGE